MLLLLLCPSHSLTHTHRDSGRQWGEVWEWAVTDVVDIDIELALVVVAFLPLGDCVANYWCRLQLRLSRD